MRKRIIKVTATYDLDDPELKNAYITPAKTVEEMVRFDMARYFGEDEGYLYIEVEVIDEDN